MKLITGKRIGQSGQELASAIFFSLLLHSIVLFAGIFLYMSVAPRTAVPLFYQVALVSPPPDAQPPAPAALPVPPVPPKQEAIPKPAPPPPKPKKPSFKKSSARSPKSDMPDLAKPKATPDKPEPAKSEPEKQEIAKPAPPPAPASAPSVTAKPGPKQESVAVATPQQDFKFIYYLQQVREKIGQHWNPPPDARNAKARVIFRINRSGWVGEVNLDADQSSGSFTFKQAAIRAIRSSHPFPRLPDDYPKQFLDFSVDLMPEE